ncbi:hypothetical protein V3C99_018771 [Haemonchus contortus]|nr:Hypothetical protein CBG22805 [Haemonchus contortus]
MRTFLVLLVLLPSVLSKQKVERKDFMVKKGNTEVFDETVKTNPRSFDYDFTDDLRHEANRNDAYDEHVGFLPAFDVFKRGENQGVTGVPVVTRGVHTWSTPAPIQDSFPYHTRSTPFARRVTPTPSSESDFNIDRQPVMLQADEVKRLRELLIGAPGAADAMMKSSKFNTNTPIVINHQSRAEVKEVKKLNEPTVKMPTPGELVVKVTAPTTSEAPTTVSPTPETAKFTVLPKKKLTPTGFPKLVSTTAKATTAAPLPSSSKVTKKPTSLKKKLATAPSPAEGTTSTAAASVAITEKTSPTTVTSTTQITTTEATQRPTVRQSRIGRILPQHLPIQPEPVFKFATIMGVRKQRIGTTVSPRPGGIWRRGGVIVEDTTTRTMTSTTNKPTIAYLKDGQSAVHHIDEKRVKAETKRSSLKPTHFIVERPSSTPSLSISASTPSPPKGSTVAPKPVIIQQGTEKYRGPTFNCRILNPFQDGAPSVNHDPTCTMSSPGVSKDGSCRCFFTITSRDENGCAQGFIYACKPLWNTSVVV